MRPLLILLLLVIFNSASTRAGKKVTADLSFASHYGDHMVLQQAPKQAMVWGFAKTLGSVVKITVQNDSYSATVQKNPQDNPGPGVWKVLLKPTPSSTPPVIISVKSVDGQVAIKDVLFGDVWLCSGQSNMQFTTDMMLNASEELEGASKYTQVRLFTASQVTSDVPLLNLKSVEEVWSLAAKDTVGHQPWKYFSAVCWLYGRMLYDRLKYPVGLIDTTWGGTPVEAWSSPDALRQCYGHSNQDRVKVNDPLFPEAPGDHTVLWNAMIHPFLNTTIYGAIWYQGEANASPPTMNKYKCTFRAMIVDWRQKWHEGTMGQTDENFPFGFVQLAPWRTKPNSPSGFSTIRWHQTYDMGYVPNYDLPKVFMAVAMDLPDPKSPWTGIHPRDKIDVAKRLVLSGLAVAYGKSGIKFQGPLPSAYFIDIGYYTLRVEYDSGKTPLEIRSSAGFELCCSHDNTSISQCNETSTLWHEVPLVSHDSTSVTMSYGKVAGCVGQWVMGMRYAWRETPCEFLACPIYSVENGLPAPPYVTVGIIGYVV
ncbi:sialate O-acetylesterase [Lingula anatina]|uniref:Sialate O-acetylesterase n=1 Tax=Lingula anatina TaxID=7574 RepID=A0A1S3ICN6_LINAN|nr:sialate O-acetylesterase [Lingula anatina]|eukprot:XP_013395194.1 sialate O-acetylesterase [Lingula anatina]